MPENIKSLIHLDKAKQEIAKVQKVDDAKAIRDKAEALRIYAKQTQKGLEIQNQCAEIKIRAERRAGELLKKFPKEPGKRTDLTSSHDATRLQEMGITTDQSHRWQLEAEVPEKEIEKHIAAIKESGKELTSVGVRNLALKLRPKIKIELPTGKFRIIYADPPWKFKNIGFEESAEKQYPTMSTEELCAMPVRDLTGEEAALFLWVTNAFLEEGLQICKAWGFGYKTNMVWIKNSGPSIGWFTLSRHELLFIATKGEGVHPKGKPISWFKAKSGKHSQKPESIYEMIESMYEGPYIELFARHSREGWESWGNEI